MSVQLETDDPSVATCTHEPPSVCRSTRVTVLGLAVVVEPLVHDTDAEESETYDAEQFEGALGDSTLGTVTFNHA